MPKLIAQLILSLGVAGVLLTVPGYAQIKAAATADAARSIPPKSDLLPFRAAEKTLPNGLKIIVVPTGFPNLVSLQIPV